MLKKLENHSSLLFFWFREKVCVYVCVCFGLAYMEKLEGLPTLDL